MAQDQLQTPNIADILLKIAQSETPKAEQQSLLLSAAEFLFAAPNDAKAHILEQLLMAFGTQEDNQSVQKISFERNSSAFSHNNLQQQHLAGIILYDLIKNALWWNGILDDQKQLGFFKVLLDFQFEGATYELRNLQARILSQVLIYRFPQIWDGYLELIIDTLSSSESSSDQMDVSIRALLYFMKSIEDEKSIKKFHEHVPKILPGLFSAFTNDEAVDAHGRELVLDILYYCLRTVSWADGIDNELVDSCLQDTFNSWMSLFVQIIQTNPRSFFDIKKNALKCLTVIFRDFINYSRDCLQMILQPAWKLLNQHVPVYTEIIGYQTQLKDVTGGSQDEPEGTTDASKGFESDDDEDPSGVEGMTQNLIELLTTLVQRQNLQEVIRQGIIPLMMTVASYMILPSNRERQHVGDYNLFIHDKDEDIYKQRAIRNSCLDLISSLIEVFGDDAVQSILFVIESFFHKGLSTSSSIASDSTEQSQTPNFLENVYISSNKKHHWKRREVALFLIGNFAEDISMFRIRNPQYNLRLLINEALVDGPEQFESKKVSLKTYLRGRTLWCASQLVEIMPRDYEDVNSEVLKMSAEVLIEEQLVALKLVATKTLIKFSRKVKPEVLQIMVGEIFEAIIDELTGLLDTASMENIHLPIEAFTSYSKLNETIVAQMAPKITPKLLKFFKTLHHETSVANELLNLFKIWCNYDACRDLLVNEFIPFILSIIELYYNATPNADNKDSVLVPQAKGSAVIEAHDKESKPLIDASILTHVMDLLCTLLKRTKDRQSPEFAKIMDVFPKLLNYVHKSDDMFLLLNGVSTLRTFINIGQAEILKRSTAKDIIDVAKKMLLPSTNENTAICIGNYVIQIFHKIEPKIDTNLLMSVVWKIYKSRMPSAVQSLILIFSRLIHSHPKEILDFLSETSIDNRISLKIVLDKWLLQQPLFRGFYTRNTTLSALLKIFMQRDPRIESLMVIGYNPSHSNVNSEVNAPFKILSLMLRYLDNEISPKKATLPKNRRGGGAQEESKEGAGTGLMAGYKMKRDYPPSTGGGGADGERLDTIDVQDDDDDDYQPGGDHRNFSDNGDDDDQQDDLNQEGSDDVDSEDERRRKAGADRIEVNLDDVNDEDDNEGLLKGGLLGSGPGGPPGLFTIKESNDRGLADMETGSEVYMSELLAGFDMEDFDEAEEQNEEDLLELGDSFGNINLKNHVLDSLQEFIGKDKQAEDYINYCIKQLLKEDQELAKKYLKLSKSV